MSYLNRVWMAATVAVVQGHPDQGCKWKSGLKSLQHGKRRFFSGMESDLRPLVGMMGSDLAGVSGSRDVDDRRQADDSLRRVMYLNCWGQS